MIRNGDVLLDGRPARKGAMAAAGAEVTLLAPPITDECLFAVAEPDAPLIVLYEDAALIAVAKPAGVPSQPIRPGERGTLANSLVARFPECRGVGRDPREAGLAHRLDTNTSGVLLAARDAETWHRLREAFGASSVRKHYLALVVGEVADHGRCDAALVQRGRRVVVSERGDGLPASTAWTVVERFAGHTLLRCATRSGRMHQVRVHLAHAGWPIVGDALYGGAATGAGPLVGHFLHAESLELVHPTSGELLRVEAPLPGDREATLALVRQPA